MLVRGVLLLLALTGVTLVRTANSEGGGQASNSRHAEWSDLLSPGRRRCAILGFTVSPRYAQLQEKFTHAARVNRDWFFDYVAEAAPGPLAWHPNLGLSQPEWEEYLRLTKTDIRATSLGSTSVQIGSRGRGTYVFLGEVEELRGLSVSTIEERVTTPFGACSGFKPIAPKGERTFGPWQGFVCTHEEGDPRRSPAVSISFSMGRVLDSGDLLIQYKARRVELEGEAQLESADVMLRCGAGPNESVVRPPLR